MTAPESPADLLRRAADRLLHPPVEIGCTVTYSASGDDRRHEAWLRRDGRTYRVVDTDPETGAIAVYVPGAHAEDPCRFDTIYPDEDCMTVVVPERDRLLAASLLGAADRWDENNILDRPESGEMEPPHPEAWWCGSCSGAIESPDYPGEDQRCTCGWWSDMLAMARAVLGETEG